MPKESVPVSPVTVTIKETTEGSVPVLNVPLVALTSYQCSPWLYSCCP
ncbi:hypothetical protein F441_12609 [Phytophthora nicotianae CJ01A1]|uniref:Uncharacterized protein n=4 Tax=Phytophthora nicotianae TaxID=4792 RepID=V9ESD1_PHYNI|nr:hypothetical protein F443_12649 [Phytophthora nicotianae P1569]ETK82210.1 hypothetical protein L915_12372 [Phytophthora nicotianae]ETO70811.1 hypothetical protein F444_12757 [Phytophthora nicotianae P1976]ETP11936.1 hypothetical protein F441_12609 [Phytophthora nicotianae CJ01A1]